MNPREFFYLVKQMRQAQIDYFELRQQRDLRRARALEREVDNEINRVVEIIHEQEAQF